MMSWQILRAVSLRLEASKFCCRSVVTYPTLQQSASSPPGSKTDAQAEANPGASYRVMPQDVSGEVTDKIITLTSQDPIPVKGYDFSQKDTHYSKIIESVGTTGFQSSQFADATNEINRMLAKKLEPLSDEEKNAMLEKSWTARAPSKCTIFLGYTSNIITCGLRETLCFLAKHNLIDCLVTTAGGIEEDFLKCFGDFYIGEFHARGRNLWSQRVNRAGNIFIPESHYYRFTDFMQPILDDMLDEQNKHGMNWTPSKMIARMGKEINDESSVYYWAYKNNIPVFSPAITDGAIGDEILYLHDRDKNNNLRIDIAEDSNRIINLGRSSINTGMIAIGAGIGKHHICQANVHREPQGADYAVFMNSGQEFDGSDSGARPDEAVTWGKIKPSANPVKVYGEASLLFPLLVAETFAKLV